MADHEKTSTMANIKAAAVILKDFENHRSAPEVATDSVIASSIREQYPDYALTITPSHYCNLLGFAEAGNAKCVLNSSNPHNFIWKHFRPPKRADSGKAGEFTDSILFAQYDAEYQGEKFIAYNVAGSQGTCTYYIWYLLHKTEHISETGDSKLIENLLEAVSRWSQESAEEVLIFDRLRWKKNKKLHQAMTKASWDDVILSPERKKSLISDIEGFFDREEAYREFSAPWKRGILLHGTPGNGKTTSLKAAIRGLSVRSPPIPSLYVKSLVADDGTSVTISSVEAVFAKARDMAPCLLIFEDIDSLITEKTRTYFLNEVDGLESNDGILMVGSTNDLDKLDPGLSKRPSRFDRKYFFDVPDFAQRVQYCKHWRKKLTPNKGLAFPESLCEEAAKLTEGFSFAYLKELFLTTLLSLANAGPAELEWENLPEDDPMETLLGKALVVQAKQLKDEMGK